MCTELLPPAGYPTAVNKIYISYKTKNVINCFWVTHLRVVLSGLCCYCNSSWPVLFRINYLNTQKSKTCKNGHGESYLREQSLLESVQWTTLLDRHHITWLLSVGWSLLSNEQHVSVRSEATERESLLPSFCLCIKKTTRLYQSQLTARYLLLDATRSHSFHPHIYPPSAYV
jgi:hypothetical protein